LVFISIRGHIGVETFPYVHLFTWINIRIGAIDLHFLDFPDFLVIFAEAAVVNSGVVVIAIPVIIVGVAGGVRVRIRVGIGLSVLVGIPPIVLDIKIAMANHDGQHVDFDPQGVQHRIQHQVCTLETTGKQGGCIFRCMRICMRAKCPEDSACDS
jgi:hypothetical protein